MNGLRLLLADPDPAGLPAPFWLLKLLLLLTFALHVVFMNAALGGGVVWLFAANKARHGQIPSRQGVDLPRWAALAALVGRALPVATAFAITTGVAPLLFLQVIYGQLFYTSSILMAWPWLAAVGLLLAGYYATYGLSSPGTRGGRARAFGLVSAAAFPLIAFIFSNNMTLMLRPELHAPMYLASAAGLYTNASDGWVWVRVAHMLVGAVAITGLLVAWAARARRGLDPDVAAWVQQRGVRLFIGATIVELIVGAGFFMALPFQVREVFVVGLTPDPVLLAAGVVFAVAAVLVVRRSLLVGSVAIALAIADMVLVRDRVRTLMLEPYFQPETLPVAPQMGAFALFAVLLLAGLGVVGWMVIRFRRYAQPSSPRGV